MPVQLNMDGKGETLIFTLIDEGEPFDPTTLEAPDTSLPAEERPIGGLGVFLLKQIMDEVRYERQGTRNILTMTYTIKQ